MRPSHICFFSIITLIALITGGCNEELYNPNDEKQALVYIKKAYDDGLHSKAIESAREFKLKHPYARSNIEIDLLIADSYFQLHEFLESAIHYGRFIKLYPKHMKIPYALYRMGLTHWKQAPRAIDRDQAFTEKALKVWVKLEEAYPASPYTAKARKLIKEGTLRLLGSKRFIASFYCRQKVWHSCAQKASEILTEEFSDYPSFKKDALKLSAKAFKELAKLKRKEEAGKIKLEVNRYFRHYSSRELDQMAEKARAVLAGL